MCRSFCTKKISEMQHQCKFRNVEKVNGYMESKTVWYIERWAVNLIRKCGGSE